MYRKIHFFRFKEREENVKADIFHAYMALLKQTKPVVPTSFSTQVYYTI